MKKSCMGILGILLMGTLWAQPTENRLVGQIEAWERLLSSSENLLDTVQDYFELKEGLESYLAVERFSDLAIDLNSGEPLIAGVSLPTFLSYAEKIPNAITAEVLWSFLLESLSQEDYSGDLAELIFLLQVDPQLYEKNLEGFFEAFQQDRSFYELGDMDFYVYLPSLLAQLIQRGQQEDVEKLLGLNYQGEPGYPYLILDMMRASSSLEGFEEPLYDLFLYYNQLGSPEDKLWQLAAIASIYSKNGMDREALSILNRIEGQIAELETETLEQFVRIEFAYSYLMNDQKSKFLNQMLWIENSLKTSENPSLQAILDSAAMFKISGNNRKALELLIDYSNKLPPVYDAYGDMVIVDDFGRFFSAFELESDAMDILIQDILGKMDITTEQRHDLFKTLLVELILSDFPIESAQSFLAKVINTLYPVSSIYNLTQVALEGNYEFTLWTQEGDWDESLSIVQEIIQSFVDQNRNDYPGLSISVEQKETETLREDFQVYSLVGEPPEILWTISDHIAPFVGADLILNMEPLFDASGMSDIALGSVSLGGKVWAFPISIGNHLMLYYNKELVPAPPQDTDQMIQLAQELSAGPSYGLVFNQNEPYWLVPWLAGFGGQVLKENGNPESLNSPEMVAALDFIQKLKYEHGILPEESDYIVADQLFKDGRAAMLINGDWSFEDYRLHLGDTLGIARIPRVTSTGLWPSPYVSGKVLMFSKSLEEQPERLEIMKKLVQFVGSQEIQTILLQKLKRLPVSGDIQVEQLNNDSELFELLLASQEQMEVGTPMPNSPEMMSALDAMRSPLQRVMNGSSTPVQGAQDMQDFLEFSSY